MRRARTGTARARALLAAVVLFVAAGCGYHAVYGVGGSEGGERFAVVLARSLVPSAPVSDDVVRGVRTRLVHEAAFRRGGDYPRIEIEVLRADEASAAITKDPTGAAGVRAAGLTYAVVARGWVRRSADGPEERDTGDLRVTASIAVDTMARGAAVGPNARGALFDAESALRSAAFRAGDRIGLRVLGVPVPADDTERDDFAR